MAYAPRRFFALLLLVAAAPAQAQNLLEAYQLSLMHDPSLAAARAQYEAAIEAKPQARALLLPQVSAGSEIARNRDEIIESNSLIAQTGVARYDSTAYNLSLTQTIFNWAQFSQLKQSDAALFAAEAQYASARQEQLVRVAERYFDVLAAEDGLRTALAEKTAIASQLERARKRFEVGLSPILDVQEAQARYDIAVAEEIEARRLLRFAREGLREVTGRFPETLAQLRDEIQLKAPEPQDAEQWVQTGLNHNLQVQGAQAQMEIARSEVQTQTGGHYPTLNLVGSYDYFDRLESPFGGREQDTGALGLQLAVPLYSGGGTQSRVRQSRYTYEQRQAELEQARREVEREVRNAYDGVVAGISRVEALKQAVKSNRTALATTEAGYRVGARTAIDTLDAQSVLYGAERDYARARYDYLLNTLRLKQASGQLSAEDLAVLNALLADAQASPAAPGVTEPAPGYPPGVIVAPEKPVKLEQPLPATPAAPAPETAPPAPAPGTAPPDSDQ
jgi:outer membrane protein